MRAVPGLSPVGEFIRPHVDADLIRHDFGYYPQNQRPLPVRVPMILTTVKSEGCAKIADLTDGPLGQEEFPSYLQLILGSRANAVIKSQLYDPSLRKNDSDAVRSSLEQLGTDFIW